MVSSRPTWTQEVCIEDPEVRPAGTTTVSNVEVDRDGVRFDVCEIGVPVLVKISYFPNWQASGAEGPYRVTPNLMVVIPTEHPRRAVPTAGPPSTSGPTPSAASASPACWCSPGGPGVDVAGDGDRLWFDGPDRFLAPAPPAPRRTRRTAPGPAGRP